MHLLGMNIHHAPRSPKSLIRTPKIHRLDPILPQRTRAHDAWLHRHIQHALPQYLNRVFGQDLLDGDELGVPSAVHGAVGVVHAAADDDVVVDEDAADGRFVAAEGVLALGDVRLGKERDGEMGRGTISMAQRMKASCFARSPGISPKMAGIIGREVKCSA